MVARKTAPKKMIYSLLFIAFIGLITACGGNLAGEPNVVATLPPVPTEIPDRGFPIGSPDIAFGQQIFAARCVRCHGQTGRGDGSLFVSGELTVHPTNFTLPEAASSQSPEQWFATITDGRLDSFMPPWRGELGEDARWDVALFTYTLAYRPESLTLGQAVWEANCVECHGTGGRGDGIRAGELGTLVGDLTDQTRMVMLSDSDLFNAISAGSGADMPEFAETLTDEERAAVSNYVRTLGLSGTGVLGSAFVQQPTATEEPRIVSAPESLTLSGSILGSIANGTDGASIPAALPVTLHIFDTDFNEQTVETIADAEGNFRFDDISMSANLQYIATVPYQDRTFTSALKAAEPVLELPVTIYEITDDPANITITNLLTQITGDANGLHIAQVIRFTNSSDRMYSQSELVDDSRFASVAIPIPPQAQAINVDNPSRYMLTSDNAAMIDTRPVLPGSSTTAHIIYTLPYDGRLNLEFPLEYALNGDLQVLVNPPNLRISGESLIAQGSQTLAGSDYATYSSLGLTGAAGERLTFEVRGDLPDFDTDSSSKVLNSNELVLIVLVVVGAIGSLSAAFLYFRNGRLAITSTKTGQNSLKNALIHEIAELDDLHALGQLDEETYRQRRDQLKARLSRLLDE